MDYDDVLNFIPRDNRLFFLKEYVDTIKLEMENYHGTGDNIFAPGKRKGYETRKLLVVGPLLRSTNKDVLIFLQFISRRSSLFTINR